ncbi:hypothetical protein [Halorubrum sp. CSM-61]|uniref:hypothetical protein n=1 Tax=Halorubrum sp. CSM-61 TaxID=2485838 RepID=UPI0013DDBE6B|nr:hypothetical protein [Halorubrum sp. CSM-61]
MAVDVHRVEVRRDRTKGFTTPRAADLREVVSRSADPHGAVSCEAIPRDGR